MASLLAEMKELTARVTALVGAVKSYSQLDRASMQDIDVTDGLESTLLILGHKIGDGITVVRENGSRVPRIEANPGERTRCGRTSSTTRSMPWRDMASFACQSQPETASSSKWRTRVPACRQTYRRVVRPLLYDERRRQGHGPGLDISRRIVVERHHGEISIVYGRERRYCVWSCHCTTATLGQARRSLTATRSALVYDRA